MRFKILLTVFAIVTGYGAIFAQQPVLPSPQQVLWHEMEQIMFVCIDPCTWQGREYDNHSVPLNRINPTKLDVNQWIDAAKSFDAKMILFVAKHVGGFCWWQTEASDYSIKNTPYKNGRGDVLDELAKACFERGMKLGVYIYPGDETWGAYNGGGGKTRDPAKQEAYNRVLRKQWEEVLSRYGKQTVELWFDGSIIVPLEDVVKKYAPSAIVFQGPFANIRWVGNERGICPYPNWYTTESEDALTGVATAEHSNPDGDTWIPVEVDVTQKDHYWFWNATNEKSLRNMEQLMDIYYQSVGRGAMLLLNSAPDTTGLIPAKDMELYRQFGDEIHRRFGKSIAETSGNGQIVELQLSKQETIDHVIIQEDISFGQRVRQYVIEGRADNNWTVLARGLSIGQKRIEYFSSVKVDAIRLNVVESTFTPVIKRLAVFNTGLGEGSAHLLKGEKIEKNIGELRITSDGQFEFDLSPFIPLAEQYGLRFKAGDAEIQPIQVSLWLQGIETPGFATVNADGSVRINITAYPDMKKGSIIIKGRFDKKPPKACQIYLQ
jgi:alpha-L-fucosidase